MRELGEEGKELTKHATRVSEATGCEFQTPAVISHMIDLNQQS